MIASTCKLSCVTGERAFVANVATAEDESAVYNECRDMYKSCKAQGREYKLPECENQKLQLRFKLNAKDSKTPAKVRTHDAIFAD